MKVYDGSDIRNIGVVGHGDHGKTSLVAAALHTAGVTNRLTRVDEGNTVTDYDEEEINRKVSVSSSLAHVEWDGKKINLIDTPGYNMFINDAKAALIAADAALVVVDAVAGVEVQTEKTWEYAAGYGIPRFVFINKMARERANFQGVVDQLKDLFGSGATPVAIPMGSEQSFKGVIDLLAMKAYEYVVDGDGKGKEIEIPAEYADEAQAARETLLEAVAETDEELLNAYLEEMTLPDDKLHDGLRKGIIKGDLSPVLCGSGLHNVGVDLVLSFLAEYGPSPLDRGEVAIEDGSKAISSSDPLSLFVFKTSADPFAGHVTYFKVVSGVLDTDEVIQNYTREESEKFARISVVQGKDLINVPKLHAGDIGAVAKLKNTQTGDSLGDKGSPVAFKQAEIPPPAIAYAIEPKTRQDEDRLSQAIHKVLEEDPSLNFYRDPQTKEFLVGRQRAAAPGGRVQQAGETLQRQRRPEGAEDPLPGDHPQQRGRARAPQEADRRTRPVRRLQDQDGADGSRRRLRVRGRDLRRCDSEDLHPGGGERHLGGSREGLPGRLSGGRFQSGPLRRVLPRRGLVGARVQAGGP